MDIISNKNNIFPRSSKNYKHQTTEPQFRKSKALEGEIKVFDQNLFDRYDKTSRVIIKKKLEGFVMDNPDIYGEDIIVTSDDIPYEYIELQVYGKWNSQNYPYFTPFVFERKMRLAESTLFICFSADYKRIVMFSKKVLTKKKYKIKNYPQELIHYVTVGRAVFLNTEDLNVDVIKKYGGVYDFEEI